MTGAGSARIVDLTSADADEVLALLRSAAEGGTLGRDPDDYALVDVQASLAKAATERLALGARADGSLVGLILGSRMAPRRFRHVLTGLSTAVDASWRGRGIGRLLFVRFLDRADHLEPRIDRIELTLQVGNPSAQRLYESLGFVVEGVLRHRVATAAGGRLDDVTMARLR